MSQSLAKDFNFRSLLKFAFPSIIMMIFMSLYSIVDGFFIAQYVDSMALSAANIVYPAVSILLAVGIMFGTGGSAVVAAKIGQGKQEEANRNFSALAPFFSTQRLATAFPKRANAASSSCGCKDMLHSTKRHYNYFYTLMI